MCIMFFVNKKIKKKIFRNDLAERWGNTRSRGVKGSHMSCHTDTSIIHLYVNLCAVLFSLCGMILVKAVYLINFNIN